MEKITKYFKHDYENDTTIEYVNTGLYSMLNCSFTSEDPDYGTDTIHSNLSSPPKPREQMAYEVAQEIAAYLDATEDGTYRKNGVPYERQYGVFSNSTLYAIEKALHEIAEGYHPNKWYATIADASFLMAKRFLENSDVTFAFCESDREEAKGNPVKHEDNGGWHGVKRIPGFFDNEPNEFIVAVGHYGGGNVGFGYADYEATDELSEISRAIRKAICEATGWDAENYIYIEEDEKEGN